MQLLEEVVGELRQLSVEVPAGTAQVLPASTHWRSSRRHGLHAERLVDGHGFEARMDPDAALEGSGASGVGVELLFVHAHD